MRYDYEGTFLEQWAAPRRSLIVNQFCYAVRDGAPTVAEVLKWVARDAEHRLRWPENPERAESQRLLLSVIDDEETRKFAEHILWRESLPYEEKQRLKNDTGQAFKEKWMAQQPPTKKQIAYLDALACHVIPANRLEASQLIEKYKGGRVGNLS